VKRLQELLITDHRDCDRRGWAGQRTQRLLEQTVRANVADFALWTAELGWTLEQTANVLHLTPRTLRHWQQQAQVELPLPLGRPIRRAPVHERNAVIELLDHLGPATGIPTLRACFPTMARAELADLLRRYRRVYQRRHQEAQRVLHWTVPGSVWAMDFSEADHPIDGIYTHLFAVRDLASGQQLLWQPTGEPTAELTIHLLTSLFALYAAPLILKSDNGSTFTADATLHLFEQFGVIPLFSPAYWPRYNGAIEAGIGSLKTRTAYHAACHGHPGTWTYDDVSAAQAQANATSRPQGHDGPCAEDLWQARTPVNPEERIRFQTTVERHRQDLQTSFAEPPTTPDTTKDPRSMERQAIQRALVEHGYLLFTRRRIPLPFQKKKMTIIT
jgi:transposase InsO family protein